jgi:hypothetical protein
VDDRCGILVATPTAANVASALQRLVDDPRLRAMLGAAGPAHARRVSDPAARLKQVCSVVRDERLRTSAA